MSGGGPPGRAESCEQCTNGVSPCKCHIYSEILTSSYGGSINSLSLANEILCPTECCNFTE